MELEFGRAPKAETLGTGRGKWAPLAFQLRQKPLEWGSVVMPVVDGQDNTVAAGSLASRVRLGGVACFAPKGAFEAVVEDFTVFMRYLGLENEAKVAREAQRAEAAATRAPDYGQGDGPALTRRQANVVSLIEAARLGFTDGRRAPGGADDPAGHLDPEDVDEVLALPGIVPPLRDDIVSYREARARRARGTDLLGRGIAEMRGELPNQATPPTNEEQAIARVGAGLYDELRAHGWSDVEILAGERDMPEGTLLRAHEAADQASVDHDAHEARELADRAIALVGEKRRASLIFLGWSDAMIMDSHENVEAAPDGPADGPRQTGRPQSGEEDWPIPTLDELREEAPNLDGSVTVEVLPDLSSFPAATRKAMGEDVGDDELRAAGVDPREFDPAQQAMEARDPDEIGTISIFEALDVKPGEVEDADDDLATGTPAADPEWGTNTEAVEEWTDEQGGYDFLPEAPEVEPEPAPAPEPEPAAKPKAARKPRPSRAKAKDA